MLRTFISLFSLLAILAVLPSFSGYSGAAFAQKAKDASCCVDNCKDCAKRCEEALAYSLKKGGAHAKAAHINALKDCIALCKACTDFDKRNSPLAAKLHALCAEACKTCGESCKSLKDKNLKDCVDQCNSCETSCNKAAKKGSK